MDTRFLTICDTCGRTLRVVGETTQFKFTLLCVCKMGHGELWDDTVKEGHPVPPQVDRTKDNKK